MNYLTSGKAPKRWGNAHQNIVPVSNFRDIGRPYHRRRW